MTVRLSRLIIGISCLVNLIIINFYDIYRTVMGAKGSKVQKITTDFNVQIKFPDKAVENGEAPPVTNGDRLE